MKSIVFILSCLFVTPFLYADAISDIWKAIESNDRDKAKQLIAKAQKNKTTQVEATLILQLLNKVEVKENSFKLTSAYLPNLETPNPYFYALWHEDSFTNGYEKKQVDREKFLLDLLKGPQLNPMMKGSLRYILGMHYGFSNKFKEAKEVWKPIDDIREWQFVGPFDNVSGSGFNKNYAPIKNPDPKTEFKSKYNAPIYWFSPQTRDFQPWIGTEYFIPEKTAITYAQSFLELEEAQELVFATGFTGNIKIWVNDELILQEAQELRTDMDFLKAKVKLPKGNNRVLIQLGTTTKSNYPNFMLRIFDKNGQSMASKVSAEYQSYNKGKIEIINNNFPHFSESFFEKKIKTNPSNILNYILLAKAYNRSSKFNEAIKTLEAAKKISQNNLLIQFDLLTNYFSINDRTKISKQLEVLRAIDAEICFFPIFNYEIYAESQDFAKLEGYLNEMKDCFGEEHEEYLLYYCSWLSAKKEYQKLVEVAEIGYEHYPENTTFLTYKFNILNNIKQEPEKAVQLLEDFLSKNYNFSIYNLLRREYAKQKNKEKEEATLLKMHELYPADGTQVASLIGHYYKIEDLEKALFFTNKGLGNTPYKAGLWSDRAHINKALGNMNQSIKDFKKSIIYNPNSIKNRALLRELEGKPTIKSLVQDKDRVAEITSHIQNGKIGEDNFEYLFYDKAEVVYPEGPHTTYFSMACQINSEAGIERWKESNIPFNEQKESLFIDRVEIFKKNGEKVMAERNQNQLVFTSLEIGDIIFAEYHINHYKFGKLAKEFWDKFTFDDFVSLKESRYRLFVDKNYPLHFAYKNFSHTPKKNNIDDFICYDWGLTDLSPIKEESYMPTLEEVGKTLSISSIKSWDKIANWYQDLALPQAKEGYNLQPIYDEIFTGKTKLTDIEKAKAIYQYISDNIQYSSLSFRQSNFVPQKPMVTISTKLGDCKDVSTLFYTLAEKAGLSTNLVLVNTRDNGEVNVMQPSIDFNHCIIKINLESGPLFQELTDNKLPFGTIPNAIQNAQALVIPTSKKEAEPIKLINIPYEPIIQNNYKRHIEVNIVDKNLAVSSRLKVEGQAASSYRSYFQTLTKEESKEKVAQVLDDYFEGDLVLNDYNFINLEKLNSDLIFDIDVTVEKEVLTIGEINAIKPPFMEQLFSLDAFSKDDRVHPLQYWKYEDSDKYEVEIIFNLPEGSTIVDVPKNLTIKEDILDYQLTIEQLTNNQFKIIRKASIKRPNISSTDYANFRKIVEQIIEAENAYIAFK